MERRIESLACSSYERSDCAWGFRVAIYEFRCVRTWNAQNEEPEPKAMFRAQNCWYRVYVHMNGPHPWASLVD